MFADVKSGAILKPNDLMAIGLLSLRSMMSCEICGANVTLKVGFDGLAASLIAYCRASFSLRIYNDGSSASKFFSLHVEAFYRRCSKSP